MREMNVSDITLFPYIYLAKFYINIDYLNSSKK